MLAEAQAMTTVRIGGVAHSRIAYGKERRVRWDTSVPCHDCTAAKGQLHVLGCDVEECPTCTRQLISCDCTDDDDADDDDDGQDEENEREGERRGGRDDEEFADKDDNDEEPEERGGHAIGELSRRSQRA